MRRRRRGIISLEDTLGHSLALLSVLIGANAQVSKCCPPSSALDADLSECVPVSSNVTALRGFALRGHRRFISCSPSESKSEQAIVRHDVGRGILVLRSPNGSLEIREDSLEGEACIDVALSTSSTLEGPYLYSCTNNDADIIGTVKKCCPLGQNIDPLNGTCVDSKETLPFHLPHRFIKHESTLSSTQRYSITIQHRQEEGHCQYLSSIKEIYVGGRLSFGRGRIVNYSCVDRNAVGEFYAKICYAKGSGSCPGEGTTCILKCCEMDEVFHYSNSRCVKVTDGSMLYFPEFHTTEGAPLPSPSPNSQQIQFKPFHIQHLVRKECSEGLYKVNANENIYLLANGSLYHEGYEISQSGFCVDNFVRSIQEDSVPVFSAVKCVEVQSEASNWTNSSASETKTTNACESKMARFNAPLRIVYTACGACSLLFLILTFAIYSLLPNFRNLHGKIVMSNITAIFLTTLFLIIAYNSKRSYTFRCVWTGYSLYYSGLSMFCWMSIMCFDLCWTFVRAKIPRKGSDRLKFYIYSFIAWTIPAIFCGLLGALDSSSKSLAPQVGKYKCFLNMTAARRFFYFPIFVLLCFNVIMYLITIGTLWKSKQYSKKAGLTKSVGNRTQHSRAGSVNHPTGSKDTRLSTRLSRRGGVSSHVNVEVREQLVLFTKLFLIMGITWISECIHVEIHGDHNQLEDCNFYLELFFRIIGGLNMLRGFGFFVIFICKRSIYTSLQKKYPKFINAFSSCCLKEPKQFPHSPQGGSNLISPNTPRTHQTELTTMPTKNTTLHPRMCGRVSSINV